MRYPKTLKTLPGSALIWVWFGLDLGLGLGLVWVSLPTPPARSRAGAFAGGSAPESSEQISVLISCAPK